MNNLFKASNGVELETVPALIAEVRRLRELHTMNQDALDEIPALIAEIRRLREVLGLHGILVREELNK